MEEEIQYYCVEKHNGSFWQRVGELGTKLTKDQANEKCDELKAEYPNGQFRVMKDKRS